MCRVRSFPSRARAASNGVRGFSLVELMIVVALLGIVAGIALPSFSQMIAKQRVSGAAADIHAALLQARGLAISRNADVSAIPAAGGWAAGWAVQSSDTPAIVFHRGGELKGVGASSSDSVTFKPSGRAGGTFSLTLTSESDSSLKRCVRVAPAGRPTVEKGACS